MLILLLRLALLRLVLLRRRDLLSLSFLNRWRILQYLFPVGAILG